MKVVLPRQAREDLRSISRWIARDNRRRAETFVAELEDRCRSLSVDPERFPVARNGPVRAIRKLTHGNYLIFYAIAADHVIILRVVHGARNWLAFLEGLE